MLIKKFDLKKDKYILAISRLVRHKGIHYLIQAFKELKIATQVLYTNFVEMCLFFY